MKRTIVRFLIIMACCLLVTPGYAQHKTRHKKNGVEVQQYTLIDSIIDFAKTKLGCAYRSGGMGPSSFDCSGFTTYVFDHFGIKLGRSSRDQFLMGEKISKQNVQRGDLVFWYRGSNYIGHVGLVTEVDSNHNFTFIHSATHGKGVRYDYSNGRWYSTAYAGARRIIFCDDKGRCQVNTQRVQTAPVQDTAAVVQTVVNDTAVQTAVPAAPVQTPAPAPKQPKVIYHKIKSGETLNLIARKYHVSVNQIKKWNHLRSDMIYAGNKLKIYR